MVSFMCWLILCFTQNINDDSFSSFRDQLYYTDSTLIYICIYIFLQLVKDTDIKPFPMLWHEDNAGRGQQGRER